MTNTWIIAINTISECLRRKIIYIGIILVVLISYTTYESHQIIMMAESAGESNTTKLHQRNIVKSTIAIWGTYNIDNWTILRGGLSINGKTKSNDNFSNVATHRTLAFPARQNSRSSNFSIYIFVNWYPFRSCPCWGL